MQMMRRLFSRLRRIVGAAGTETPVKIDFRRLSDMLHYKIRDERIFYEALSHRSYLQVSNQDDTLSNERLEFLGDSVLNLVVGEYLFNQMADANEGDLTVIRSRLVNRKALSKIAHELGLMNFILMSPGAAQVPDRGLETILSDAYEAIVGALYLDGGYREAENFIERSLLSYLKSGVLKVDDDNFKSQLLERAQACGYGIPRYVTVNETGPDHDRTFTVEVFIGNESYGRGSGKNKKAAEQGAAKKALEVFKPEKDDK
jgi:ribonuclease-3